MADEKKKDEISEETRRERERLAAEANKKRNEEMLDRRNAIADSADEMRAADFEDFNPDETKDETEDAGTEEEVVQEAQKVDRELDEARDAGADDIRVVDGKTQYRTVVNGREKWQSLAELRATAQKVESADEYLHTAKETFTKAAQLAPSEEKAQKDAEAQARRTRLRETLSRAVMGDDEALDALAQSIDEGPSRVTPDVLQLVDQRVDGRMTFRQAAAWFDDEYKEELSNPNLKKYIVTRDTQMAQEHPDMPFKERLQKVGDEVREMRAAFGGPAKDSKSPKQVRKESAAPAVQAAQSRQRSAPEEDEEGYESAIDRMAKARGQPRAHKH